jgi:hypothetical protein
VRPGDDRGVENKSTRYGVMLLQTGKGRAFSLILHAMRWWLVESLVLTPSSALLQSRWSSASSKAREVSLGCPLDNSEDEEPVWESSTER